MPCPPLCTIWEWQFCMLNLWGSILHGKWQSTFRNNSQYCSDSPIKDKSEQLWSFYSDELRHFFLRKKSIELRSGRRTSILRLFTSYLSVFSYMYDIYARVTKHGAAVQHTHIIKIWNASRGRCTPYHKERQWVERRRECVRVEI